MKLIFWLLLAPLTVLAQSPTPTPTIITADKIGINTTPTNALLHMKTTYPAGVTAGTEMISFETPTGANLFSMNISSTLQGDNPTDDVFTWGFNVGDVKPNEPSLHFAMESAFGFGDTSNYEVHLEIHPLDGGVLRPWTWALNRKTGRASVVTKAETSFAFGSSVFQVLADEVISNAPQTRIRGNAIFETEDNGGNGDKQIQIRPHPTDSSRSWLLMGGISNGASLFGDSSGVNVRRNGASLNNGDVRAGRFFSYAAGSGTTAKVAIDDNVWIANGGALLFSASENAQDFSQDVAFIRDSASTVRVMNPQNGGIGTVKGSFDVNTSSGGAYKTNGVKVVGAQCGAISDSDGTAADNARAINSLLGCLRSHGLVAP